MAIQMPINGEVLQWALDERHLSPEELGARLGVDDGLVRSWLDERAKPNKGQLTALTKFLRLPPSTLFLPEPPPRTGSDVNFRRHPNATTDGIPDETANAIKAARTALRVGAWLDARNDDAGLAGPIPRASADDKPDVVAERLREWLDWSVSAQTSSGTTDTSAAKSMRSALQRHGVIVLHLTMDDVTRGFSLHHGNSLLIAINTRDHVRARMFSYAHELAHLALRDDSVCLTRTDTGVEGFCNRVAAALLMPSDAFRAFVRRRLGDQVSSREHVVSIRNHFKVSMQAAAIRAESLSIASEGLYDRIGGGLEQRQAGGTYIPGNERTRPRLRVDQYGSGFVNALLDAEETGVLRRPQLLDLLRLSEKELWTARHLAASEAEL